MLGKVLPWLLDRKLHTKEENQKCSEGRKQKLNVGGLDVAMVNEYFIQAGKSTFHARGMQEMLLWRNAKWTEPSGSETNSVNSK